MLYTSQQAFTFRFRGESEGSNKPKPITTFVKSHQDLDKDLSKPMAQYNPDDLIGRTFLLPTNQKGERHRASIKQEVIEISEKLDASQNAVVDNINFLSFPIIKY